MAGLWANLESPKVSHELVAVEENRAPDFDATDIAGLHPNLDRSTGFVQLFCKLRFGEKERRMFDQGRIQFMGCFHLCGSRFGMNGFRQNRFFGDSLSCDRI